MSRDRAVTRTESAPVLLVDDTPANLLALQAHQVRAQGGRIAGRSGLEAGQREDELVASTPSEQPE